MQAGESAQGFIRVERTTFAKAGAENALPMRLETALYLGERWEYLLRQGDLRVRIWGPEPLQPGEYWVQFHPEDLWLF